jgi:hypothetical protein
LWCSRHWERVGTPEVSVVFCVSRGLCGAAHTSRCLVPFRSFVGEVVWSPA